jgi:class 3 adenylate cyclase
VRSRVGFRYFRSLAATAALAVFIVLLANLFLSFERNVRTASKGLREDTALAATRLQDWLGALSQVAIDAARYAHLNDTLEANLALRRVLRQESAISAIRVSRAQSNDVYLLSRDDANLSLDVFDRVQFSDWRTLRMANALPIDVRAAVFDTQFATPVLSFRDKSTSPVEAQVIVSRNFLDRVLRGISPSDETLLVLKDQSGSTIAASQLVSRDSSPTYAQWERTLAKYLATYSLEYSRDGASGSWVFAANESKAVPWTIQSRTPLSALFTGLLHETLWNLAVAGLGILAVLMVAHRFAARLSQPVVELHTILNRVRSVNPSTRYEGAIDELDALLRRAPDIQRELELSFEEIETRIKEKTEELNRINETLERRVAEKVSEVERLSRLKRFVPTAVAQRISELSTDESLISRRKDVAVVFVDIRGFTAFASTHPAETVLDVLHELHECVGASIDRYEATVERFTGDGVMVFFNDPMVVENPCALAIEFAFDTRDRVTALAQDWRAKGLNLGVGIGVAYGTATVGVIGYASRVDYGAIGPVTNLASRLCSMAAGGEIWIAKPTWIQSKYPFPDDLLRQHEVRGLTESVDCIVVPQTLDFETLAKSPNLSHNSHAGQ